MDSQARGAMNAVLKYMEMEAESEKGTELHLITHSSGNFAQAVRNTQTICLLHHRVILKTRLSATARDVSS